MKQKTTNITKQYGIVILQSSEVTGTVAFLETVPVGPVFLVLPGDIPHTMGDLKK